MLRITSHLRKQAWVFGIHISELNLPPETPVFELFNMTQEPVTLYNNDEISVVADPSGDQAKLVAYTKDTSSPMGEQLINLDMTISEAEQEAAGLGRQALRSLLAVV